MKQQKSAKKVQIVNIIMGIIVGIYSFVPWLRISDDKCNGITYLIRVYRQGFEEIFQQTFSNGMGLQLSGGVAGGTLFTAQLFCVLMIVSVIVQLAVLIYVVASCLGYQWIKIVSISAWIYGVLFVFFYYQSLESTMFLSDGSELSISTSVYAYFFLFVMLEFVWILLVKMLEEWDTAAAKAKKDRIKKREDKIERHKRLVFPGKYSKLYYRVLWRDLLHRKKDFLFLFLAEFLCAIFLFVGGGIYSMLSAGYGEDYGLLGLGLVEIIRDFIVVISLLSVFLFSVVFSFYRRNRMRSSGVYETLGIRSRTLYASWIGELVFSIVSVLVVVFIAGSFLLRIFKIIMEKMFPQIGKLGYVNPEIYIGVVIGIVIIFISAVVISREIDAGKASIDARNAVAQSEKIPGRFRYLGVGIGSVLMFLCVWFFFQRRMAESMWIFGVFLISMAVFISNGCIILLDYQKQKKESHLKNLPARHMIFHRYKTTVMYVSLLTVVHICVMVFFGVRFISNEIATEPAELFPYDYVCLANTGDNQFFKEMEEECVADIVTFPMVRVSAMDGTEAPEDFRPPIHPQGQHIGISESTYRELKVLKGDTVKKNLGLDAAGTKVHIIYQQDQASKAKPVDWYIWTAKPYLHIGNPVLACNRYERKKIYPSRTIVGEETGSLIGTLRQGRYEDIIVFSDEYFQQVQDAWKRTSIITGRELTHEDAQVEGVIEESPTILQLINIQDQYKDKADRILKKFENQYGKEQKYDPLVRRVYGKKELVKQREMEHRLESFLNGFIMAMLLAVSLFLLHMKVKMELSEMKARYLFMERLGMRQKERILAEKREISRFVYIPLMISAPIIAMFTVIIFRLRLFGGADMLNYGMYFVILIIGYVVLQLLNLKWLQYTVVKQVEKFL